MLSQEKHKTVMFNVLSAIYRDQYLSVLLGFKGGTACYIFYQLPRFSVDLDFDIVPSKEDNVVEKIFERLDKVLADINVVIKEKYVKRNTVFFLLSYEKNNQNLKLEISKRDDPNTFELKDFYGLQLQVLTRSDIFAHKLVAATDRKHTASRDFFDIYFFLKESWPINEDIIKVRTGDSLKEYLQVLKNHTDKSLNSRNILQGLGELVDEKQKIWIKNNLKIELLRIISFYIDSRG